MKEIPLTRGLVALIDDADFDAVSAYKWYAAHRKGGATFYARRTVNPSQTILMHRAILCAPSGVGVDHINCNGLDNRRSNLRLATSAQNAKNRGMHPGNTSGYKGVCWHPSANRWQAQIKVDGRNKYLGLFPTPVEAHAAYCAAAKELHGEFARFA